MNKIIKSPWFAIIIFCIVENIYQCRFLQISHAWRYFRILFIVYLLVVTCTYIFKKYQFWSISNSVGNILILYICSTITALVFNEQNPIFSIMGLTQYLPLCIFFILKKHRVESEIIVKTLWMMVALYFIIYFTSLLTFPNNIFGYSMALSEAESSIEQRGVLRLGVPGPDIVILALFFVITRINKQKKIIWLLIPLIIMLLMRGTRTPIFIAILCSIGYLLLRIKNKWFAGLIFILSIISIPTAYDAALKSKSNNLLINYIQMTHKQIEVSKDGEEDIRLRMSKFYMFEFNDNVLETVFGNGVPYGESEYCNEIQAHGSKMGYYAVDSGYIMVFLYFGLIGVCVFIKLLIIVINTSVRKEFLFVKIFIIHLFISSFAGHYLLLNSVLLALSLYLLEANLVNKKN